MGVGLLIFGMLLIVSESSVPYTVEFWRRKVDQKWRSL